MGQYVNPVEEALTNWLRQNNKTNKIYDELSYARTQFYDAKEELDGIKEKIKDNKIKRQARIDELWANHNRFKEEKNDQIRSIESERNFYSRRKVLIRQIVNDTEDTKERVENVKKSYEIIIASLNEDKAVAEEILERQRGIYEEKQAEFDEENAERTRLHNLFTEAKEKQRKNTP